MMSHSFLVGDHSESVSFNASTSMWTSRFCTGAGLRGSNVGATPVFGALVLSDCGIAGTLSYKFRGC